VQALRDVQAQLQTPRARCRPTCTGRARPDRLAELDDRVSAWMALARRYRRQPQELPALLAVARRAGALDAASDLAQLEAALLAARRPSTEAAPPAAPARRPRRGWPPPSRRPCSSWAWPAGVRGRTAAADGPQSFGLETWSSWWPAMPAARRARWPRWPRAASCRASRWPSPSPPASRQRQRPRRAGTLIFDEIDVGVGGAVAETVGRLMKQLGRSAQVLAVTHLPQVAACADRHLVVAKACRADHGQPVSPVAGEARVAEIARMLGGERLSSTSLAHAQEMLDASTAQPASPAKP
jgi:DNA repair protein RecN (Recombination protein N)